MHTTPHKRKVFVLGSIITMSLCGMLMLGGAACGRVSAQNRDSWNDGSDNSPVPQNLAPAATITESGRLNDDYAGASEIMIFSEPPDHGLLDGEKLTRLDKVFLSGDMGFDSLLVIERQDLRPSHVYTYHNEDFRPGGALYRWHLKSGELEKLVDAEGGQLLDLQVSYDGKEVLFSWRRRETETYHIYRMNIDGSNRVQLTEGDDYNFNPAWLPDGGIAFLSTRAAAYAYCWDSPVGVLYRMDRDGSNVVRLSANYLNDFTPNILHDGRIIYSRWEYVDRPAIPIQSLWTIRPDGTGLQVYYGNRVLSPATFMEARPIPGSDKVLCLLTAHNRAARGGVGILDRRRGVNAQEAIRNLTPEVDIGQVDRGNGNHIRGPYENPFPLDDTHFIVSRDGTILVRDYDGTEETVVLERRGGMGFFNPQPVRASPVPPVLGSSLGAPAKAGSRDGMATLYLQDIYMGLEPHVKRGEIARLRVVEEIRKPIEINPHFRAFGFQFPVVSSGATYAPKRVWGEVEVEPDGSAAFTVPTERPIYFMALDGDGRALQRMRTFTHLMPGETQSCIGCHEDPVYRSMPPPNKPAPTAFLRPPKALETPEWGLEGFSYKQIVQPVLDRNCVSCHNPREASGDLDLSGDMTDFFNVSYEHLARQDTPAENPHLGGANQRHFNNPYTSWISTYNNSEANILEITPRFWGSPASPLADVILSGHPDEEGKPRIQLEDYEKRRILAWIDLNVPYYGTSDSNHRELMGSRRMWPDEFEQVFEEIASRRCVSCHQEEVPQKGYLRVEKPELNRFMLAPLAKSAGGTEACGKPVFQSKDDTDYQALLDLFDPIIELLENTPRLDLYGEPVQSDAPTTARQSSNFSDCGYGRFTVSISRTP